uniref:P3 protein n=1 Tax=Caenorhabditis tropicalis TaxID=1561998 RepID=A0A1I7TQ62_9PELO
MGHISGKQCPMVLIIRLLLQLSSTVSAELSRSMSISYSPPSIHNLEEYGSAKVNVTVKFPQEEFEANQIENYLLDVNSFHPETATADYTEKLRTEQFRLNGQFYETETIITINGNLLGKTAMKVRLVPATWNDTSSFSMEEERGGMREAMKKDSWLDVWVVRSAESRRLTVYFVISVVVLISMANVMMGCELDIDSVIATLKKPVAPAIGLFAQFIIMPLLSYLIAYAIFMPRGLYSMALGLFVTGCSPGGGASNFWTLLLDGNLNLSVTMTFISTICSLVMMPAWLYFLGHPFLQGFNSEAVIKVPYGKIASQLVTLILPLLIGIAIKKWKPEWAAKARKVMRPFVIFVMIFVVIFGSLTNLYMFRMLTGPALIGGLALPWCGFMFGCFTALLTKRKPEDVTAIAVETGIQNTGIAILLLKASFGQPDADIGSLIPVIVAAFTPGPLLLGAAVHLTFKWMRNRRNKSSTDADSIEKQAVELVDASKLTEQQKLSILPNDQYESLLNAPQKAAS